MKRITIAAVILAGTLAAAGCTTGRYAQSDRQHRSASDTLSTMKKQDVISLSKAGVGDSLIITMLNVSDSWFDLKTQDVIELKNAGVSDKVINAMMGIGAPTADSKRNEGERLAYYYPPYYWNSWYYPYWYYPSFYWGFSYHRPIGIHRFVLPHHTYFGNPGYRSPGRISGRRR